MPSETFVWQWEEAFQKHGFFDGDNPQHNEEVGEFLQTLGYSYLICSSIHNSCISCLSRAGVEIDFPDDSDPEDIRTIFPKDVLDALDKQFPTISI